VYSAGRHRPAEAGRSVHLRNENMLCGVSVGGRSTVHCVVDMTIARPLLSQPASITSIVACLQPEAARLSALMTAHTSRGGSEGRGARPPLRGLASHCPSSLPEILVECN